MNDQQTPINGYEAMLKHADESIALDESCSNPEAVIAPRCPLPTPELVAALANQYIEELRGEWINDRWAAVRAAMVKIVGGYEDGDQRSLTLCESAMTLADTLDYPRPYETQVTLADGRHLEPERHTITHFTDGEGFTHADWAAISALEVGEAYIVQGSEAVMTVTRKE